MVGSALYLKCSQKSPATNKDIFKHHIYMHPVKLKQTSELGLAFHLSKNIGCL